MIYNSHLPLTTQFYYPEIERIEESKGAENKYVIFFLHMQV